VFFRKTLQLPWKWGTEHEKARRIALAQCNLAVSFHHGNGVGQDKKEAVKYYRLTAEQGNSFRTLSVSGQMENLLHKDHKEFDQQTNT
jgi:TPR repeat protein